MWIIMIQTKVKLNSEPSEKWNLSNESCKVCELKVDFFEGQDIGRKNKLLNQKCALSYIKHF